MADDWGEFEPMHDLREQAREASFDNMSPWPPEDIMRHSNGSGQIEIDDFYAYMPMHNYIHAPSRDTWPASSIDARLEPIQCGNKAIKASAWLDKNRPVEQMTWTPGEPTLIRDRLISEGGWIVYPGYTVFNLYREPNIPSGNALEVKPWLDHLERIYREDIDHIVRWFAHRVQRPGEKINHALVLGGPPGIGKDTLMEPVKYAIGPWNFVEVSPAHMLGRFNGFVKSVILRVSEARDLGDVNRFAFYDHMKVYLAAPPDVLRCDEKNLREYSVPNVCGVVVTTNYKTDGIFLPGDDRRHYVAWSESKEDDFSADYWNKLYAWYLREGYRNVASYLAQLDLSRFDSKAPPKKTAAFWAIVDANRSPEDADLAEILDEIGKTKGQSPVPAVTLNMLVSHAGGDFLLWLQDRKNRRAIPHRLESADYVPVRNDTAKDGMWKIRDRRQAIYAHRGLSVADRIRAARSLTNQ